MTRTSTPALLRTITNSKLRRLEVSCYVHRHPGKKAKEIASALNMSYQSAQRHLGELRRKGLVVATVESDGCYSYRCHLDREDYFLEAEETLSKLIRLEGV